MFKKLSTLIIAIALTNIAYAQKDSLIFNGSLSVKGAATYTYKIVVGMKEGKWLGYSLLDADGPNETKTSLSIQFAKEKKAMAFAEKKLLATKSKEQSFCVVGGALKMNDKGTQLKGFFLGQDEKKKLCGSGTIKLSVPEKAKKLMTPDGTRDTNISAIVTRQKSETIKVKNEKITLEIWDGGVEDNDSLVINLNGKELMKPFKITSEKRIIEFPLSKGENLITIKALNEGNEAPNSARFIIVDGSVRYPVVSFLKTNENAEIKLKKD